jgi:hypothetical protein
MKKNSWLYMVISIIILIALTIVIYLLIKDKLFVSFEDNKTFKFNEENDYYNFLKNNDISKIEVTYNGKILKTINSKAEIDSVLNTLKDVNVNRVSVDRVNIGDSYLIILYGNTGKLNITISPINITINNKYYKTDVNVYEKLKLL